MKPRIAKLHAVEDVESSLRNSLPSWFTANRVHGHTRLTLSRWHDTPEFNRAAAGFEALGARCFTRHVKTGDDDPWWPAGEPPPPNVVQQFIDSAHREGLRIFAYYWHMSEKSVADSHPEWVCKKLNGTPISAARRCLHLDTSGPYREMVLTRLRELASMGADALFFDYRHLPTRGGAVIENNPAWPWSDPGGGEAAAAAFRAALQGHLGRAPVHVTGGPEGRYAVAYHSRTRLVVAITNNFSWVQIHWTPDHVNPAAPAATGVRVTWRAGEGPLPTSERHTQLRAIEAITGRTLSVEEVGRTYRVTLPRFRFMALVVVTRESRSSTPRRGRP
jgi:hypothetical protein